MRIIGPGESQTGIDQSFRGKKYMVPMEFAPLSVSAALAFAAWSGKQHNSVEDSRLLVTGSLILLAAAFVSH